MPVKGKKKEDVSQKVQEIKLRQQNWMKQRDQVKQQDDTSPKTKPGPNKNINTTNTAAKPNASRTSHTVNKKTDGEQSKPHVRDRFQHWINARNQTQHGNTSDGDFNDNLSIRSGAESELERLVSPDPDSLIQPVDEEHFGDLAEKIASKVKEGMGISYSQSNLSSKTSASTDIEFYEDGERVWNSARCRTFTQEVPTFNHLGTSGLTSHSCTVCKKLMLSSKHIPMMVIPCGHTLCKSCSEGRQVCPSCDCPVVSLTVNIMLQQVIQEYHAHPVPSSYTSETSNLTLTSKASPSSKTYSSAKYVEDNRRNRMASYKTQLANLQTRHDILQTEYKTLLEKQKQVSSRLHQEQQQAQNIRKQEEEVEKAIAQLQERLAALKDHRAQYENHVVELKDEKSEMEGKVTLLSTTVTALVREMEKVKLLSEGEDDSSNT